MKDTIHYQIGQQIGNFTISAYLQDESNYILTCKCGNTSKGASDHVTRKISNLLSDGFTGCSKCVLENQEMLKTQREFNDKKYVYKDVYREYVKKSKAREINFSLSIEEASELFSKNCYYCNRPPSNKRSRTSGVEIIYQGIDRVNNQIGYLSGNVVPCCKFCNSFKLDRTTDDFFQHVRDIYFNKVQRSVSEET